MAHFAKLDPNNVVLRVEVINNDILIDQETGKESEALGIAFLVKLYDGYPYWKQTSYNKSFRKNYAGIGFAYDPARDAFIAPKPFLSWHLNEETCQWEAPIPYPTDGKEYEWDEINQSWVEIN